MRLLVLLALAGAAWAQAGAIDRAAIDMMPGLTNQVRNAARAANAAAKRDHDRTTKRLRQIDARLKKKPAAEEAKKLRRERDALRKRNAGLSGRFRKRLLEAGLTEEQLERLARMPRGRLRRERYNHGVVLEAPDLEPAQRNLLERLVASTDAAQLALAVNREHTRSALKEAEPIIRRQVDSRVNQQIQQTERRFWRIAYYALTAEQMRAVRELLSPRYSNVPQPQEQMMMLPGLTPSQASRVRSLFTEYESEIAADQAEVRHCQAKLREKDLAPAERGPLNGRVREGYQRMGMLRQSLQDGLSAVLTEEQRAAYRSAPPQMNVGERGRPPWEITPKMALHGDQTVRIRKLQRASALVRKTLQGESRARNAGMMGEIGPESPQQMTMMVVYRGVQGRLHEHYRETGKALVCDILDPDQVCNWVVTP